MKKRALSLILALVLVVGLLPMTAFAETADVAEVNGTGYASLQDAVSVAANGNVVKLLKNTELDTGITISGKFITIDGQGHTITYGATYTETLFTVKEDGSLIIKNVTIDGGNAWEWSITGEVTYTEGVDWYKDTIEASEGGKLLTQHTFVAKGSLAIHNATIQNCIYVTGVLAYNDGCGVICGTNGAAISLDNTSVTKVAGTVINMNGSNVLLTGDTSIHNNYGYGNKGGLFIANGGSIEMNDGVSITQNKAWVRSGVIFGINDGAIFTMNGGLISENAYRAGGGNTNGPMISVEHSGKMIMNGGEISGNTGKLAGAIGSRWTTGSYGLDNGIYLNGGTISNNSTTKSSWYGADVFVRGTLSIGKEMQIDGTVVVNSDGILDNQGTIDGDLILDAANSKATSGGNVFGTVSVTSAVTAEGSGLLVIAGMYGVDVTEYLDEGLICVKISDDLYIVMKEGEEYLVNAPALNIIPILDDVPFVDVFATHYFYDAVKWAYHAGVTGGTDAWHFSPDDGCTRAQIVTFLWRAAGCPSATYLGNFTDVDADAYYATAVAWAVENGITNGTSATTFSPEAVCTRADAVTFLYRAFGRNPNYAVNFSDVPANAYYADAVAWAAENGVTGGTGGGKFSPADTCSRAQIVTFLYRTLG